MSQQIQITGGAKVRDLQDVIIGTSGVLSSVAFDVANGVPRLDSNGKILVSQLPNSVMEYKGTWNAATNTPTLANGTGNQGDVYLCNVAGTVNFGAGPITFIVGDSAVYSGSIWQRSGGATGSVTSVGLSTNGGAITIGSSPITTSGTISFNFNGTNLQYVNGAGNLTTFPTLITSIGLSMPSAFSVANSPLTANGTIAVTGAGTTAQYIRGDGSLATYNPGSGGGGSSQTFYFNGGVASSVTGYQQMSTTANTGASADFSVSSNGYIASFLTDSGSPNQLLIPAGNWNFEIYMNSSSSGGSPSFYVELYKYNGSTFTLISSSSANPEYITNGTAVDLYTTALTVPQTTLTLTDRLAVRVYVVTSGRTITMHTQDSNLSEVITTFSTGITALNGLTAQVQNFAVGTGGSDFNISSVTDTHTFNLPTASSTKRGALSSADWSTFNGKESVLTFSSPLVRTTNTISIPAATSSVNGYLSATDWNTFNGKQAALNGTGFVKASGTTISYDNSTYLTTSAAASTYLPLVGGTLTGALNITLSSGDALNVAGNAIFRGDTGVATPRQLIISSGGSTPVYLSAKGYGANYQTDFGIRTYNSVGTAFEVFYATSSGNVGINQTSPSYLLDVNGTFGATSAFLSSYIMTDGSAGFKNTSSGGTAPSTLASYSQLFFDSYELKVRKADGQINTFRYPTSATTQTWDFNVEGYLAVQATASLTAGSVFFGNGVGKIAQSNAQFFWDNTNNRLGIGTSSPNYKLDVSASSGAIARFTDGTTSSFIYAGSNVGAFGTDADINNGIIMNRVNNTAQINTNGGTRIFITSAGNVGIGTSSPFAIAATNLSVDGSSSAIQLGVSGVRNAQFYADGTEVRLYAVTNVPLRFGTNDTERMRITSGGNVLIGTTTDAGQKLQVNGTTKATNYATITNQATIAALTTATILTLSSTVNGVYIVQANFGSQGNAVYGSTLIVVANYGSFRIVTNGSGASAALTLSGANVQITNALGSALDGYGSAILVAF